MAKSSREADVSMHYLPASFFLLRTPALPAHVFFDVLHEETLPNPDSIQPQELSSRIEAACEEGKRRLENMLTKFPVQQALAVASLSLLDGIARLQEGLLDKRRAERVYSRLLRYIVRMSTRPTPFGLFSGVATGLFAGQSNLSLASPTIERVRVRTDMQWLLTLIQQLEQQEEIVPYLKLMKNQMLLSTGARFVLPQADIYGQRDQRSISLRATPVVYDVLEYAQSPVPYADLYAHLRAAFPGASDEMVASLLQQLWDHHFLISDLRPSLTSTHPAWSILERLPALPELQPLRTQLTTILTMMDEISSAGIDTSDFVEQICTLTARQRQLVSGVDMQPFQLDTALALRQRQLHTSVGQMAAQAAEVLIRLAPPVRYPHLRMYARAFVERYGMEAEVPLLELLSSEVGLDAPSTYMEPPPTFMAVQQTPEEDTQARDTLLSTLIMEALKNQCTQITLDDELIQHLGGKSSQEDRRYPPSLELYLQLHARSLEALDQGDWLAVVGVLHGSVGGGKTSGRFFDLLLSEDLSALQEFIHREEELEPDTIFADLTYLPPRARTANVVIRPVLRQYEIVVNVSPSVPANRVISLDDLVVGVQDGHFYIRSLRLGKKVIACQNTMVNPTVIPNVCRFLLEASTDKYCLFSSFDWGAAYSFPFLPRVVYKQLVLAPAQWNLRRKQIEMNGIGSREVQWYRGIQRWRTQWQVPRYVYLTQADNRLLLDLEHPVMVQELRTEVERLQEDSTLLLQEMLPDFEHLWLRDEQGASYFAEIVVPLLRENTVSQQNATEHTEPVIRSPVPSQDRLMVPGTDWVYLKLYVHWYLQDEIIALYLRDVVQQLEQEYLIDAWFFIRYADPFPHIRLRLHAARAEVQAQLLVQAVAWSRELVQQGLLQEFSLDTYRREVERYGGPEAISIIEEIFTASSSVISELIAALYTKQVTLEPVVVAVWSLDHFFAVWGYATTSRLSWLKRRVSTTPESAQDFRPYRQLLCKLLDPLQRYGSNEQSHRDMLRSLVAHYDGHIASCAKQIQELATHNHLWVPETILLDSLCHMHINRLLGTDREQEEKVMRLWLHALESIRLRSGAEKKE